MGASWESRKQYRYVAMETPVATMMTAFARCSLPPAIGGLCHRRVNALVKVNTTFVGNVVAREWNSYSYPDTIVKLLRALGRDRFKREEKV